LISSFVYTLAANCHATKHTSSQAPCVLLVLPVWTYHLRQ